MDLFNGFSLVASLLMTATLGSLIAVARSNVKQRHVTAALITGTLDRKTAAFTTLGPVTDRRGKSSPARNKRVLDEDRIKESSKLSRGGDGQKFFSQNIQEAPAWIPRHELKLFRSGIYTKADRRSYRFYQIVTPLLCGAVGVLFFYMIDAAQALVWIGALTMLVAGATLPDCWLQRQIRRRELETVTQLPLMIEQISVGISGALEIWPSIMHILETARRRRRYNPVIELFMHVERLMLAGTKLSEALYDVAQASGMPEVRHVFQFLAQNAEHGGEITSQLQELQETVATEYENRISVAITALPVNATGPLGMVFLGFLGIMLAGIFGLITPSLSVIG